MNGLSHKPKVNAGYNNQGKRCEVVVVDDNLSPYYFGVPVVCRAAYMHCGFAITTVEIVLTSGAFGVYGLP